MPLSHSKVVSSFFVVFYSESQMLMWRRYSGQRKGLFCSWANWASGQPNDARMTNLEDCAIRSIVGLWWDSSCDQENNFYCEGQSDITLPSHATFHGER